MSLRLLLGVLGPGLPDLSNKSALEGANTPEKIIGENFENIIDFQTPAKFHIGMLIVSLITGLGFEGFIAYKTWKEKSIFLDYVRNLIIALVFRTFFSIIFDAAILLGTPLNVGGGNALLAFEQICSNLVLAFWLTFTIYLHARMQRNFNSEPTLRLYQYGVPGVALFFAFIWIFTLQDQDPSAVWWIIITPKTQWIVNSVNLLFLLIQLALVADISRMMMKVSLDNDSISLLRSTAVMMAILILIFWLQFGLLIGRVPFQNPTSYVYFYYFIDGLECGLVCLVLFFFNRWVPILLHIRSSLNTGIEETHTKMSNANTSEVLLTGKGDRGIVTIDSVFMTSESGKWKSSQEEGTKDVVYSNVVQPDRLKKTFELYKRLNIIPTDRPTVVEGEEFYDCQFQNSFNSGDSNKKKLPSNQFLSSTSSSLKSKVLNKEFKLKSEKIKEQSQKKNAFYSSKYLILDSKENDFPKYLETRPLVPSVGGEESLKEETNSLNRDTSSAFDSLMSDDLVRQWLYDNSENMQKNKENKRQNHQESCKSSNDKNLDLKMSMQPSQEVVNTEGRSQQKENQPNVSGSLVSTITSAVSGAFLGTTKAGRKNSVKENDIISVPPTIVTAVRNDSEKSLINREKNLETSDSEKKQPAESNDVKSELNTLKPISIELKPDFVPVTNKNDDTMNEEQTENFNSESQKEALGTFESKPSQPLNASEFESKVAILELSKKELPTQLDETQTIKTGKSSESPVEAFEENSNEMDESVPLESLNQYLTYSDLLEFRSQLQKQKVDQQTSKSKNLISLDVFTSKIGSLINATGGLFFSKSFPDSDKCNKSENEEVNENNLITNKEQDQQDAEQFEGIPKPKDKNKQNDFINQSPDFGTENESFQKPQNFESNYENLESLEMSSAINADKTENATIGDVPKKSEHDLKSDSKISVLADADKINDFASSAADEENSKEINEQVSPKPSKQFEFQSLDEPITETSTDNSKIIHSPKIEKIELKPSKLKFKKKESSIRNEISTKYNDAPKSKNQKSFQELNRSKFSALDLPVKSKILEPQPKQFQSKSDGAPVLRSTENEIDESDKSSDSEFKVEKRKDSNSSCGSFSIDNYYSQLMLIQEKFRNPSNSISDKKKKTFT